MRRFEVGPPTVAAPSGSVPNVPLARELESRYSAYQNKGKNAAEEDG